MLIFSTFCLHLEQTQVDLKDPCGEKYCLARIESTFKLLSPLPAASWDNIPCLSHSSLLKIICQEGLAEKKVAQGHLLRFAVQQ